MVVLLSRAFFLPPTLEDIDSVNFALALERFDPRLHQPHPPGYPVYVALARLVHGVIEDPPTALGFLSALAQAALVFPLFALFSRLASNRRRAFLSTVLALCCPVLWFNGARPMSDSVGLLFIVSTQALLLRALSNGKGLTGASFLAGLSLGVRLQTGLLTLPLWLLVVVRVRRPRAGMAALAAVAAGIVVWAIPLILASGGPSEYARAFVQTMGDAAGSEPLMVGLTLNRAVRAVVNVAIAPWVSRRLGALVIILAGVGFLAAARRENSSLALALVAFGPYLVMHTLVQQVETVRYSLPYIPLVAWLAVEGLGFLGERLPGPARVESALAAGLVTACAALTIPALALYDVLPSPAYAALATIDRQAVNRPDWVLAGHYMFWRYFGLRPAGLDLLSTKPGQAVPGVVEHFRSGDDRDVLFLSYPRRTDLSSFSPTGRRLVGHWEWPGEVLPFLAGERPNETEVVTVQKPWFLPDQGWLLSLEAGRIDEAPREAERLAYLRATPQPTFLMMAGNPIRDAAGCTLEIEIQDLLEAAVPCDTDVLRGYHVPPGPAAPAYLRLSATTELAGRPRPEPFILTGLSYGPDGETGFVHGAGWFHPERDEGLRLFRWASPRARSMLHIPQGGARLVIEGSVPLKYLGSGLALTLSEKGVPLASTPLIASRFRLEAELKGSEEAFREIELVTTRGFVPDDAQHNGDRRLLAVRVYEFDLEAHDPRRCAPAAGPSPTPSGPLKR